MLYCPGQGCPLRADCYRHTQPSPGREAFAALPYDAATGTCAWFYSNVPDEALIRETAYYIWLRNGCPPNRDREYWDEAYLSLCRSSGRVAKLGVLCGLLASMVIGRRSLSMSHCLSSRRRAFCCIVALC